MQNYTKFANNDISRKRGVFFMEKAGKYDKNKYNIEYKKQNYKRFVMELKPEFKTEIQENAAALGFGNASEFVKACIRYCFGQRFGFVNPHRMLNHLDVEKQDTTRTLVHPERKLNSCGSSSVMKPRRCMPVSSLIWMGKPVIPRFCSTSRTGTPAVPWGSPSSE